MSTGTADTTPKTIPAAPVARPVVPWLHRHRGRKAVLAVFGLLFSAAPSHAEVLTCDNIDVTDDVVFIFDTVQEFELKSDFEMGELGDVRDLGAVTHAAGGEWAETRACGAKSTLSNGEAVDVWYRIRIADSAAPDDYRLDLCFSKYDSRHETCEEFETPPDR